MHWNLEIWKKFQAISYHNCLSRILPKIFLVSLLSPRSIHLREAILMKPQYIKTEKNKKVARKNFSVGRGPKLNVHKTFRKRPWRLLNVLYTSVYILYLQGCIYHDNSIPNFQNHFCQKRLHEVDIWHWILDINHKKININIIRD